MDKNEELLPFYEKLSKAIYWLEGKPYWNSNGIRGPRKKDALAGSIRNSKKHRIITCIINKIEKRLQAHRLRWYMAYGELPNGMLDHKNFRDPNNKDNNRLNNLRLATSVINGINRAKKPGCSSQYIHVIKRRKSWLGIIKGQLLNYRKTFDTELEAAYAVDQYIIDNNMQHIYVLNFPEDLHST